MADNFMPEPNAIAELAEGYTNIRGKDRAKLDLQWENPIVLQEFDTPKELKLCRLVHPKDIAQLGSMESHCAGTHWVWVCEEQIWHFLTFIDNKNVPHGTIHCKDVEYRGKAHPRDKAPRIGFNVEKLVDKGTYYMTWQDVVATAEKLKVELPEPGTYGPHSYPSTMYGGGPSPPYNNSVMVDGHEVVICSANTKGSYGGDMGKYAPYVQEWYDKNKTDTVLQYAYASRGY